MKSKTEIFFAVFTHDLFKIVPAMETSLGTVQTLEEETKTGYSLRTTSFFNCLRPASECQL
jgi:hypothetical protein